MAKSSSPYIVSSVDRALDLLIILGKSPQDRGVTELAGMLGVQKSTVHSLLQTLMAKGFVSQNDSGRYQLGVRLLQLGEVCAQRLDIRASAKAVMIDLANQTSEIVLLAVLSKDEMIIVDKVEPERPFLIIPKLDFTIALHSTAVGKVLLAYAPEEILHSMLERGLEKYTRFTITELSQLRRELEEVRQKEVAIGCNETIEGVTCVAVPIRNAKCQVVAALSISCASSAVNPERCAFLIAALKEKAGVISRRLGFSG